MKRKIFPLLATCCIALLPLLAFGQDRGTITGIVSDSAGASVPAATVTVTNIATNAVSSGTTNAEGIYVIPQLPPGTYKVRVEKNGFKVAEITQLQLAAGATANANVALVIGAVSETVEVVGSGTAQVQTENAKISSQVAARQIDQLPLVVAGTMRSPFDLSLLTPEAKPLGLGGQAGVGGPGYDSTFSLGGGQGGTWGVTLDGASSNTARFGSTEWASLNTPSIDAITEFSVDTNGFKAESGRAQGGSLNFSSKSGTNEYHGTAFEYLRNNYFDARNYFENRTSVLKQHDFGFSVGGPVRIPWLYNGQGNRMVTIEKRAD